MQVWRDPDLFHISWHCPLYQQYRAPLRQLLRSVAASPVCFRACAIVTRRMKLSVQDVHRIQTMLVDIWQAHIQSFTEDAHGATVQPPAPPPAPPPQPHLAAPQPQVQPAQAVPSERRGHVIQARPDGGLFCVKCGKQTQYTKHLRAKILNKVWRNKDLPQARWL